MIFEDSKGIKDLKFGLRHGIYIQRETNSAFSWGERTFGQTGNNYQDTFFQSQDLTMGSKMTSVNEESKQQIKVNQSQGKATKNLNHEKLNSGSLNSIDRDLDF